MYERVEVEKLCDYLKHNLEDFNKFAKFIANYLKKNGKKRVVIGYDTRRNSYSFASLCSSIMYGNGIDALLSDRDIPTPVTAFAIRELNADGAIMITASHNPPEYNGIKFIPEYAGPATKEITQEIEKEVNNIDYSNVKIDENAEIKMFNIKEKYIEHVLSFLNIPLISEKSLKIAYDPLYGTGRGYLDEILERCNIEVHTIHNYIDQNFGGLSPEPNEKNLRELSEIVVEGGFDFGIGNDGDADRIGLIAEDGSYINPNGIFALLIEGLSYKLNGNVARTVATTHYAEDIAKKKGFKVFETPVGFKYIGELMSCLLYTSPSPRDLSTSRMPSSA